MLPQVAIMKLHLFLSKSIIQSQGPSYDIEVEEVLRLDRVVPKEDVAPFVLHQQEEGEDGGEEDEDDADHHQETAVKQPAENASMVTFLGHFDYYDDNYSCFIISISLILITRGC